MWRVQCRSDIHQLFHLQRASQLSLPFQLMSPDQQMSLPIYILGPFQTAIFSLGHMVNETTWLCQEGSLSLLWYFGIPGHQPCWFSKPGVLWTHLSSADPVVWGAWCGAPIPHSSDRSTSLWDPFPLCVARPIWVFCKTMCLPFLLNLVWTFYPLLRRAVHLVSRRRWSICSFWYGVSVGGGKFRNFLCSPSWTSFWWVVLNDKSSLTFLFP